MFCFFGVGLFFVCLFVFLRTFEFGWENTDPLSAVTHDCVPFDRSICFTASSQFAFRAADTLTSDFFFVVCLFKH